MNATISLPDNHLKVQPGLPVRFGEEEIGIVSDYDPTTRQVTINVTSPDFAEQMKSMFEVEPPVSMSSAPMEPDEPGDGEGNGEPE